MQGVSLEQDSATVITLFASWSWTFFVKLSLYSSLENVHSLVQDLSATSQFTGSVSSGCRPNDVSQRASELSPRMAFISDRRCTSSSFVAAVAATSRTKTHISMFCACDRVHQLFRDHQGHPSHLTQIDPVRFRNSPWLALLRSPFGFPLVWRRVIHRISYSSSFRVAVFSQDCSAHSWRQNVSLLIQNGLPNEHALFRNVPKALNRSVFLVSLKPSISTARWTAGYPCVVTLE